MNKKQLIAMWFGIIAIVLMGLFPPWYIKSQSGAETQKGYGYAFIFTPPDPTGQGVHPMINMSQLCIQCFIVGLITTGYIITFKDKKPKDERNRAHQQNEG